MPEYLAPGVYVEEVPTRYKTIEGVSTSTAGFIGPTRFGPLAGRPELITSFTAFERIYGGVDSLEFTGAAKPVANFVAHAVRAFFDEGGRRLYVVRVFAWPRDDSPAVDPGIYGRARWPAAGSRSAFELMARFPGRTGNFTVTFTFHLGDNVLVSTPVDPAGPGGGAQERRLLRDVQQYDTVWARTTADATGGTSAGGRFCWVDRLSAAEGGGWRARLRDDDGSSEPATALTLEQVDDVRVLDVRVTVSSLGRSWPEQSWDGLTFHPAHPQSLSNMFDPVPQDAASFLRVPLVFLRGALASGAAIADALTRQPNLVDGTPVAAALATGDTRDGARTWRVQLAGGLDGHRPELPEFQGSEDADGCRTGLRALEELDQVSIVAAPGSTYADAGTDTARARDIAKHLVDHCERMRHRIAILDPVNGQTPADVRAFRAGINSSRGALYFPWVRVAHPIDGGEIVLPPSGFVCGILARTDAAHGVHKAPANEVVRQATGLEHQVDGAQQQALNRDGINTLRQVAGRGIRVGGARTLSTDPEWKYVNVRRYFAYLERSIEKGTQWAVFEPNGPVLWSNVRSTVEDFLLNEFRDGRLVGAKPEEAFFVRCDRTTMTQDDIDNGRLVCLVGFAPLRPAEFVVLRIGQWTCRTCA